MTENKTEDLELKALTGFCGTEQYYRVLGFNVTDGIHYIMENGYSYLVTDLLAYFMFKPKLRDSAFLVIVYSVNLETKTGVVTVREDTGQPVLYRQKYDYTNAKVAELKLFFCSGVLMLAGEY